jgi:four helix bundle protein
MEGEESKKGCKNFYDLRVWQKAHKLSIQIYKVTKDFPRDEQFGLTSQMRRASVSVTSNIAEGFGRVHLKEKVQFYNHARASLTELQSQVFISRDIDYIAIELSKEILENLQIVHKLLNALISSCRSSYVNYY